MSLKQRLIDLIRVEGPLPLSTFMQIALHDSSEGYYATRPGITRDFITAPEISPLFGELIGLWIVHEWRAMGAPSLFHLIEIGPGRAVMMQDALRVAARVGGDEFLRAAKLGLIEASPALRAAQSDALRDYSPQFFDTLSAVPDQPMLLVANEYLDCLPVRQFRRDGELWRECVIGLGANDALAFGLAADEARAPPGTAMTGACVEIQPALDLVIADLAPRKAPFRALFLDYGSDEAAPADTLRAYCKGAQVSPLDAPGETDLTADVDFARLARLAVQAGLDVHGPSPQGLFLLGLGAQARLQQMIKASPENADLIFAAAQRLIDPADMGARFKAICLSSLNLAEPAGF